MLFTIFDGKIFAVSLTNNYQAQPMVKVITETMHKYFPTNGPPNLTGKYIPSNVLAKVEISSSQKPKLKIGGPSLFPSLAFTYTFSGIDLLQKWHGLVQGNALFPETIFSLETAATVLYCYMYGIFSHLHRNCVATSNFS